MSDGNLSACRKEQLEAERRERDRTDAEAAAKRADLLARIAAKDAEMRAQERKDARRLARLKRREYRERVKAVGPLVKDPFAWMPKADRQAISGETPEGALEQKGLQEGLLLPSIPQPSWLPELF